MYSAEKEKFREGLEELLFVSPEYGSFARAMGAPVFDTSQETAYVTYDNKDKHIRFAFNPEFIMTLSMEETAAVILHEAHHVILKHLEEVLDDDNYPQKQALQIAQECIINDTVENVFQLPLPENVARGEDFVGKSCSQMPTKPVYDLLADKQQEEMKQMLQDMLDKANENKDDSGSSQNDSNESKDNESEEDDSADSSSSEETDNDSESSESESQPEDSSGSETSEEEDSDAEDNESDANSGDSSENTDEESTDGDEGQGNPNEDTQGDQDTETPENGSQGQDDNTENNGDISQDTIEKVFGCSGVDVNTEDFKDFVEAVEETIAEAANAEDESYEAFLEKLTDTADSGGGYAPNGVSKQDMNAQLSADRLNWKHLIARINPKVLDSGRKRRKTRNNWTTPNRRMRSVYPRVILPVSETIAPKKDDKGDTLPSFVIALDLSFSIPHYLIKNLQGMLNDIPKDLIKAYPVTWSDNLVEYDENTRRVCATYGTNIRLVERYVAKIEEETKTKPYVLVITDGVFDGHDNKTYGKDWFYMAINDSSVKVCKTHARTEENVYNVRDFQM